MVTAGKGRHYSKKGVMNKIMSYKYNSGVGGVICDKCKVLIDANLSLEEYQKVYGEGKDYCWKHKPKKGLN